MGKRIESVKQKMQLTFVEFRQKEKDHVARHRVNITLTTESQD
jgi:hypothetical protein